MKRLSMIIALFVTLCFIAPVMSQDGVILDLNKETFINDLTSQDSGKLRITNEENDDEMISKRYRKRRHRNKGYRYKRPRHRHRKHYPTRRRSGGHHRHGCFIGTMQD